MKITRLIILYFLSIIFLLSTLHAKLEDKFVYAVTVYKYNKLNQNRIKRLSLRLVKELENNVGSEIDLLFIDNENRIKNDFKNFKSFNSFIGYTTFFLENIDFFKEHGQMPFFFSDSKNSLSQYYLVANKDSKINSIADLKGKTVDSLISTDYYRIWLDYLCLKEFGKSYKDIIKKEHIEEKKNKILLNVYFNKVDFAIVPKSVYDDVLLLNPSMAKRLTIIEKSEPIFFYAIGIFHKKTSKKLTDIFFSSLSNGNTNKGLQDLYRLLGIHGIKRVEFKEFDKLINFYEEYKMLKGQIR